MFIDFKNFGSVFKQNLINIGILEKKKLNVKPPFDIYIGFWARERT